LLISALSFSLTSYLLAPVAVNDLISFLKVLPYCRMRRGERFSQWWMLLAAILAILSGQCSLLGMERFATRHRKTVNELQSNPMQLQQLPEVEDGALIRDPGIDHVDPRKVTKAGGCR